MTLTSRIRRQGGAAVITIPPALLKLMNVEIGAQVSLTVAGGDLVAKPVSHKRRYSLDELLVGAEEMARFTTETDWARAGEAVGREES